MSVEGDGGHRVTWFGSVTPILVLVSACSVAVTYSSPSERSPEDCNDREDNDLDGLTDGLDPECVGLVFEDDVATCTDGIDNDADGRTDGEDPPCWAGLVPVLERCSTVTGTTLAPDDGDLSLWTGAAEITEGPLAGRPGPFVSAPAKTQSPTLFGVLDETSLSVDILSTGGEARLSFISLSDVDARREVRSGAPRLALRVFATAAPGGGRRLTVRLQECTAGCTAESTTARATIEIDEDAWLTYRVDFRGGRADLTVSGAGSPLEVQMGVPVPASWSEAEALVLQWAPDVEGDEVQAISNLTVDRVASSPCDVAQPQLDAGVRETPLAVATSGPRINDQVVATCALTAARVGTRAFIMARAPADTQGGWADPVPILLRSGEPGAGVARDAERARFLAVILEDGPSLTFFESPDCAAWRLVAESVPLSLEDVPAPVRPDALGTHVWPDGSIELLVVLEDEESGWLGVGTVVLASSEQAESDAPLRVGDPRPLFWQREESPDWVRVARIDEHWVLTLGDATSAELVIETRGSWGLASQPLLQPSRVAGTYDEIRIGPTVLGMAPRVPGARWKGTMLVRGASLVDGCPTCLHTGEVRFEW